MKQILLNKFMSRKRLNTSFWFIAIIMISILIFTATLPKEVMSIPKEVRSIPGEILYTYTDVVEGEGYFQEFDLMKCGTLQRWMCFRLLPGSLMIIDGVIIFVDLVKKNIYGEKSSNLKILIL